MPRTRLKVPRVAIVRLASVLKAIVHCNHAPLMTWEDFEQQIRGGLSQLDAEEDLDEFLSWFEMRAMFQSLPLDEEDREDNREVEECYEKESAGCR